MGIIVIMDKLKLVSLNTRGLCNETKRRKVFRFMKKYKADICLLQETHCTQKMEYLWSNEWGNKCLFSNGTSEARGVAVLLNKKSSGYVTEICRDMEGRYIICKLNIVDITYCVVNLYAPNDNDPSFFKDLFKKINEMDCVHVIIGGDFNVVQDPNLDRNIPREYNKLNRGEIQKGMENLELTDIWRDKNADIRRFTWMKGRDQESWSRIDYFLTSQTLSNSCVETDILPSVQTDHSLITVTFEINAISRGPGIWKFNDLLLSDTKCCEELVDVLNNTKRNYVHLSAFDKWELMKFEAIRTAQEFAASKALERKKHRFVKYKQLSRLQNEWLKDNTHKEVCKNIDKISAEIDAFETVDAKRGSI